MMMVNINPITLTLILGLAIPLFMGTAEKLTRSSLRNSLFRLMANLEFLIALVASIFLTKKIFLDHQNDLFGYIYRIIPETIRSVLIGQELLTYLVVVPLLLIVVNLALRLISIPLRKSIFEPTIDYLYNLYFSRSQIAQRFLSAVYKLPLAITAVFVLGLLLNFWVYYFPSPQLIVWMNESVPYQFVDQRAVAPALNSKWAQRIPVLLNDSFAQALESRSSEYPESDSTGLNRKVNPRVITYFNGVTLDDAIKSNPKIDATARQIVGNEQNSKQRAYLLYKWVSRTIEYDYDKAVLISSNTKGIQSGSIVAFETRKGICFDYSSLYISMCRAVGLKVRLVTGLAYSGVNWGDHAWNQVYMPAEGRWINVDCTFGLNGNYFDQRNFSLDHRYAEIQGEW